MRIWQQSSWLIFFKSFSFMSSGISPREISNCFWIKTFITSYCHMLKFLFPSNFSTWNFVVVIFQMSQSQKMHTRKNSKFRNFFFFINSIVWIELYIWLFLHEKNIQMPRSEDLGFDTNLLCENMSRNNSDNDLKW